MDQTFLLILVIIIIFKLNYLSFLKIHVLFFVYFVMLNFYHLLNLYIYSLFIFHISLMITQSFIKSIFQYLQLVLFDAPFFQYKYIKFIFIIINNILFIINDILFVQYILLNIIIYIIFKKYNIMISLKNQWR